MRIGTVLQIWRYPVKSMAGERLSVAAMTARGVLGDRGWAVYDETRNGVTGAKRLPLLRTCTARYAREPLAGEASPPVEIRLPPGEMLRSDAPEAAGKLGDLLGRPVSLRSLGPAGSPAAERLTMAGEPPEAYRAMMGLLPDEPLPDMSEFTPERLRLLRQGNFFDALPLHLLTASTLRTLERLAPESAWDVRRFRPNLFVDALEGEGYPELGWLGRRLRVGDAVLEAVTGCPRCVMVTQAAGELPQDHRVMRTLVRETRHTAGLYARVAVDGEVREGDPVELL